MDQNEPLFPKPTFGTVDRLSSVRGDVPNGSPVWFTYLECNINTVYVVVYPLSTRYRVEISRVLFVPACITDVLYVRMVGTFSRVLIARQLNSENEDFPVPERA